MSLRSGSGGTLRAGARFTLISLAAGLLLEPHLAAGFTGEQAPATQANRFHRLDPASQSTQPATQPATQQATQPAPAQGGAAQPTAPEAPAGAVQLPSGAAQIVIGPDGRPMVVQGAQPGAPAAQPGSPLVAAVQQRRFARQPAAILQAIYPSQAPVATPQAEPGEGEEGEDGHHHPIEDEAKPVAPEGGAAPVTSTDAADPNVRAAKFEQDVLAGRWTAVGEFFESIEPEEAEAIFQHVLTALAGSAPAQEMDPNMPPEIAARQAQMQAQQGGATIILPEHVLALADAYPHELKEAHVAGLGRLLASALSRADATQTILAELREGRRHFGGEEPAARRRAADLLFAANLGRFARPLLEPIDSSTVEASLLNAHARALVAEADAAPSAASTTAGPNDLELRRIYEMYGYAMPAAPQQLEGGWVVPEHMAAFELVIRVLKLESVEPAQRQEAASRATSLLAKIEVGRGDEFLRWLFAHRPEDAVALLTAAGAEAAAKAAGHDVSARIAALRTQKRLAEALLSRIKEEKPSPEASAALEVLASNWLSEVRYAETMPSAKEMQRGGGRRMVRLPDGNQIMVNTGQMMRRGDQRPAVQDDLLLAVGPQQDEERWLSICSPSLRAALVRAVAVLLVRDEQFEPALDYLDRLAAHEPEAASQVAGRLLQAWVQAAGPSVNSMQAYEQQRMMAMMGYPMQPGMTAGRISLTRARQDRNLRELADLLERLNQLPEPPPPQDVARAFVDVHSPAEVFRPEDVKLVFGPIQQMQPDALGTLLTTMRQRLATQWRQPQIQQQAGTRRDDKAIAAEVERGYELIVSAADLYHAEHGPRWQTELVAAAALFDWNEFRYGRGLPLAEYTERRDLSFARFQAAADLYGADVAAGRRAFHEETVEPYMTWFLAALGASDLAQLTRQQTPQLSQVEQVRAAILALPGDAGPRHVDRFATSLSEQTRTISPELKDRYLRAGLTVVGADHPMATAARELVRYYDDLLEELELVAYLDGESTTVGQQPFGLHLGIRHTDALGRESGGFGRYLVQPNAAMMGYYPPGMMRNDRDRFERNIREALLDAFEIVSITWHAADVEPRGDLAAQHGWRYTPLAFLVVQAKDPSADRIAPIRMDLDFGDLSGQVVLPVASSVIALDTRSEGRGPANVEDVVITQTLDEKELAQSKLMLDVRVSAKGLVPDLVELVDLGVLGAWKIQETSEGALTVGGMDLEGQHVRPNTERTWLLTLVPAQGAGPAQLETFRYPAPRASVALADEGGATFQRYEGTDLKAVEPAIALASASLASSWASGALGWIAAGAVVLVIALVTAVVLARRRRGAGEISPFALPRDLTPFTLVALLRRMEVSAAGNGTSAALREEIAHLEREYFAANSAPPAEDDLRAIANRWLASGGSANRRQPVA